MVAMKMANKCQATGLISVGFNGVSNQIPIPNANGKIKAFQLILLIMMRTPLFIPSSLSNVTIHEEGNQLSFMN
ncbi:hypothetical protein LDK33_08885 [Furfurilactobacillus rossiae]|nr:hypothetical protein [Furfurilactobacillus milii]MCF6163769.1 hypothetical protein [Furfurilactobacillus milii]MCF6419552.1 hypothetical protein [Furfurilactobacillus milii]